MQIQETEESVEGFTLDLLLVQVLLHLFHLQRGKTHGQLPKTVC